MLNEAHAKLTDEYKALANKIAHSKIQRAPFPEALSGNDPIIDFWIRLYYLAWRLSKRIQASEDVTIDQLRDHSNLVPSDVKYRYVSELPSASLQGLYRLSAARLNLPGENDFLNGNNGSGKQIDPWAFSAQPEALQEKLLTEAVLYREP